MQRKWSDKTTKTFRLKSFFECGRKRLESKRPLTKIAISHTKGKENPGLGCIKAGKIWLNLTITWNVVSQYYRRSRKVNWGFETKIKKEKIRVTKNFLLILLWLNATLKSVGKNN